MPAVGPLPSPSGQFLLTRILFVVGRYFVQYDPVFAARLRLDPTSPLCYNCISDRPDRERLFIVMRRYLMTTRRGSESAGRS